MKVKEKKKRKRKEMRKIKKRGKAKEGNRWICMLGRQEKGKICKKQKGRGR